MCTKESSSSHKGQINRAQYFLYYVWHTTWDKSGNNTINVTLYPNYLSTIYTCKERRFSIIVQAEVIVSP